VAIASGDANTTDVKYKPCWTEHVLHVLRNKSVIKDIGYDCWLQNVCFTELKNLIDLHTKIKECVSLEDTEKTSVKILGEANA